MNVFAKGQSIYKPNIVKFQTIMVLNSLVFKAYCKKRVIFIPKLSDPIQCLDFGYLESSPFHHSIYLSIVRYK